MFRLLVPLFLVAVLGVTTADDELPDAPLPDIPPEDQVPAGEDKPGCTCKSNGQSAVYRCGEQLNKDIPNNACVGKMVYVCQGPPDAEVPAKKKAECKHACHEGKEGSAVCARA